MRIAKKVRKGLLNFVHILYVFLFVWMCKARDMRMYKWNGLGAYVYPTFLVLRVFTFISEIVCYLFLGNMCLCVSWFVL